MKKITGKVNYIRQDIYFIEVPIGRWQALKSFWFGTVKICWDVPATNKNKTITLKGKLKQR